MIKIEIEGYEPDSVEFLRKEHGLYHHLRDLFNKGELTIWEMNTVDKIMNGHLRDIKRGLIERGLMTEKEVEKV